MGFINMERELLRASEVALATGLSRARIYQLWRDGVLPVTKIGRHRFITREALHRFFQQGGRDYQAPG